MLTRCFLFPLNKILLNMFTVSSLLQSICTLLGRCKDNNDFFDLFSDTGYFYVFVCYCLASFQMSFSETISSYHCILRNPSCVSQQGWDGIRLKFDSQQYSSWKVVFLFHRKLWLELMHCLQRVLLFATTFAYSPHGLILFFLQTTFMHKLDLGSYMSFL